MVRRIAGCRRDKIRDTEKREQLQVTSLSNQIREYRNKREECLHRMRTERMQTVYIGINRRDGGPSEDQIRSGTIRSQQGISPVSYTHLDVYKRQHIY